MKPWDLNGGPDPAEIRRLVVEEGYSDADLARLYGATRQTANHWRRTKCPGLPPGPGMGRQGEELVDRAPKYKWLIWWTVASADQNDVLRKRLVLAARDAEGDALSSAERRQLNSFLAYLARKNVVVNYDRDHEPPWHLLPRNPDLDAPDQIVRRPAGWLPTAD